MANARAFHLICITLALSACTKATVERSPEPALPAAETTGAPIPDERVGRGEAVAELACASCHAIGADGDSPHAEAPPFGLLSQSVDIGTLKQAFADGTVSDHPDMPNWDFDPLDVDALIVYLETVQVRDPG
jgi:mono/diheme cytochrome c family protein